MFFKDVQGLGDNDGDEALQAIYQAEIREENFKKVVWDQQ
jgi:hypothetical protein